MFETESLEKVHVDDRGTGRDHHVNHLVAHHVNIHLHTAGGASGSCKRKNIGAIVLTAHHGKNVGSTGGVTTGERHSTHSIDKLGGIILLNVDVFDGFF